MTATDDGENRRSHLSNIDMFSSFPGNVRVRHDVQCYVIGSRAIFSTIQDSPDRLSVLLQTWLHTRKKILSHRKSFLSIRTNHVSTAEQSQGYIIGNNRKRHAPPMAILVLSGDYTLQY